MKKLMLLIAVLSSALVFVGVAAGGGGAVKGINLNCVNDPTVYNASPTVNQDLGAASSQWLRIGIDWARWEPSNGYFDPSYAALLDNCFSWAHSVGQSVVVVMGPNTPAWARGTCNTGINCPPANPADYGNAAAQLANNYCSTSTPQAAVNAFEVWNEPNRTQNWSGTTTQYANTLTATTNAVHTVCPSTTVLLGGTAAINYTWDQGVMSKHPVYDALAVHPYPTNPQTYYNDPAHYLSNGTNDSLSGLRGLLCTYKSNCATPIWFTEAGFVGVTPPTTAQMGTGMISLFNYIRNGTCSGCSNVSRILWFTSWDENFDPYAIIDQAFGLRTDYTSFQSITPFNNGCNPCRPIG